MVVYKIKHKETGLFFCPVRTVKSVYTGYVKSNLSKVGKVYLTKPNLKHQTTYKSHLNEAYIKQQGAAIWSTNIHCDPDEHWEIIEL